MRAKKQMSILLVSILTLILSLGLTTTNYAADATVTFGLQEYRKERADGYQYGYKIGNNKAVWKIVKYENGGSTFNYDNTIYCLKAEQGFFNGSGSTGFKEDYNKSYDFTDKDSMPTLPVPEKYYNAIMWILNNAYVPTSPTAEADKLALLTAAGLQESRDITDDDIDVVQQLAIWYFTNEENADYHKDFAGKPTVPVLQQSKKKDGIPSSYQSISDINEYLAGDIQTLYEYIVNTAKTAGDQSTSTSAPISMGNTNPTVEINGSNYVIGPYKIEKHNETPYTLNAKFTNQNNQEFTYSLLNENKVPVSGGTTINDLVGKDFYISVPTSTDITQVKFTIDGSYKSSKMTYWTKNGDNTVQPIVIIEKVDHPIEGEKIVNIVKEEKEFDLALRKFISQVNNVTVNRAPQVDVTNLANGSSTTATYNHTKVPVAVKKGDIVTYTIRVYNEGDIDGYVGEITDYLPEELEFINDPENYPEETLFNAGMGWILDGNPRKIKSTKLAYSSNPADTDRNAENLLKAFNGTTLDFKELQVKCKVKDSASLKKKITNLAQITNETDAEGGAVTDRDSVPNGNFTLPSDQELPGYKDTEINRGDSYIPGQEDDDDFEKIILEEFDLALRKFITGVNDVNYIGREPQVDVTNLANGTETTAIYNHPKTPINVSRGDTVIYTIRVYNEGNIAGYANEITDYLPEELEFLPDDELNKQYEWEVSEDGRTVTTRYLSKEKESGQRENLIDGFNGSKLDYKDVKIKCKVKDTAEFGKKLTNLAEITEDKDQDGSDAVDRDSDPDNIDLPSDEELPGYKDEEIENGDKYIPGQEDDDDFEKVKVVYFDLALRKFITGVNDTEVTNRIPEVSKGEDGKLDYNHTKDPVEVENGNVVTYTLRIYNEGLMSGYANKVADDVPDGLVFLPENEINKEYRWVMYKPADENAENPEEPSEEQNKEETQAKDKEDQAGNEEDQDNTEEDRIEAEEEITYGGKKYVRTDNPEEATLIQTDYLSKEQEKEEGANLIRAFDPEKEISSEEPYNPDYRDIKIAFKVTEPNTSDRIIVNTAEITDDRDETNEPVEDVDSTPGNNNEWETEDDLDKEFIKVKYFDLALRKIVSKAIIIEDGKQTVIETNHQFEDDPEEIVKVDLHRKDLDKVTVKFEFRIRVTNEGEIAGYAKEVTDYIPEGLKFVQEDNPGWYPRESLDGRERVGTRALENTLLQPGESAEVSILLTWINGSDNVGLKTNWAEISEDYNDSNTPDIDSTPDNFKEGEDDIDEAPVMLSIELGQERIFYGLTILVLATIGAGTILIKKFVLH